MMIVVSNFVLILEDMCYFTKIGYIVSDFDRFKHNSYGFNDDGVYKGNFAFIEKV